MLFRSGGLGYSSTGVNGPYGLAMTQDGAIVADFITSGVMNAARITAGILSAITIQSLDEKVNIDLSQSGKVEINGGALEVRNNNNTVIIDGEHNMHKIMASGSLQLTMEVGETVISHQITHGLGYAPCNAAYAELTSSGNTYVYAFPYISYVNFSSGMIGIGFLGRCWASSNVLEFVFNRPIDRATTREVINIRYYIYKEVAI